MQHLIMLFSPVSCYVLPLTSKSLPHQPILKHHQLLFPISRQIPQQQ